MTEDSLSDWCICLYKENGKHRVGMTSKYPVMGRRIVRFSSKDIKELDTLLVDRCFVVKRLLFFDILFNRRDKKQYVTDGEEVWPLETMNWKIGKMQYENTKDDDKQLKQGFLQRMLTSFNQPVRLFVNGLYVNLPKIELEEMYLKEKKKIEDAPELKLLTDMNKILKKTEMTKFKFGNKFISYTISNKDYKISPKEVIAKDNTSTSHQTLEALKYELILEVPLESLPSEEDELSELCRNTEQKRIKLLQKIVTESKETLNVFEKFTELHIIRLGQLIYY